MKIKCATLVLFAFAAAVLMVRAQNPSSDESGHILALETAWNHALEAKDTAALQMLLASNMVALDSDGGLMTKASFLGGIKAPDYQPGQVTNEKITVRMYGETAIVSGVYRERNTASGKSIVHRASFVDTWVKQGATWQCVASVSVNIPEKSESSE